MISRERGNPWPIIGVAAGAFLILFVIPLLIHRQQAGRMATVDAQVSIGDTSTEPQQDQKASTYRWPNSEVPITAERLRDVTACALAAAAFVVEKAVTGRPPPKDAGEILVGIAQRRLIPAEWLTNTSGVLQTSHGTIHLRYSARDSSVELISEPNQRTDGPAILIRIPDLENVSVGTRYFEAMQLDGVTYPQPFAPISEIITAGWQPRYYKQSQLSDSDRSGLEQWVRSVDRK